MLLQNIPINLHWPLQNKISLVRNHKSIHQDVEITFVKEVNQSQIKKYNEILKEHSNHK